MDFFFTVSAELSKMISIFLGNFTEEPEPNFQNHFFFSTYSIRVETGMAYFSHLLCAVPARSAFFEK